MRVPGHHMIASIVLIGLALGGCDVSKEPYKAYEGSPAGVESIAVSSVRPRPEFMNRRQVDP